MPHRNVAPRKRDEPLRTDLLLLILVLLDSGLLPAKEVSPFAWYGPLLDVVYRKPPLERGEQAKSPGHERTRDLTGHNMKALTKGPR